MCDRGVIADQWGQEDWLTDDDYYVTHRSRLSRRCHRPRIAVNQVLCTGFPVFIKEVQGQGGVESKVPVTKTSSFAVTRRQPLLHSQGFSRAGFDLGVGRSPILQEQAAWSWDWGQVNGTRVWGPQSIEYCSVGGPDAVEGRQMGPVSVWVGGSLELVCPAFLRGKKGRQRK